MLSQKMIFFAAATLTSLITSLAIGGPITVGNGGDVVEINGKTYLLDLVEFGDRTGNHLVPFYNANIPAAPEDLERLKNLAMLNEKEELLDLRKVAQKIAEVRTLSPGLAEVFLRTIEMFQWEYSNYPLVDIGDENTKVNLPRIQLGIRQRGRIDTELSVFQKLEPSNRPAYIFHEIIYALVRPTLLLSEDTGHDKVYAQQSSVAREINAYLFSQHFTDSGIVGLVNKLKIPDGSKNFTKVNGEDVNYKSWLYLPMGTLGRLMPNIKGDSKSVLFTTLGVSAQLLSENDERNYDPSTFLFNEISPYMYDTSVPSSTQYACITHYGSESDEPKNETLMTSAPAWIHTSFYGEITELNFSMLSKSNQWIVSWKVVRAPLEGTKKYSFPTEQALGKLLPVFHKVLFTGDPKRLNFRYSSQCSKILKEQLQLFGIKGD